MEKQENIDPKLREALRDRLQFRYEFLSAMDQDMNILESRSTDNFATCLTKLKSIKDSVPLGKEVPESFSLKIQRKLASTVPPRPIVKISHENAFAHSKRLCQDVIDLEQMLDYRGPGNFKTSVWTLLSRKPQPSVYIRCLVQALAINDLTILGSISIKQLIFDDIAELVLPSSILLEANTDDVELPSDPRFQIARNMNAFVTRFSQVVILHLKTPGNRY